MTNRELMVLAGAGLLVLFALAAMASLHERHYRTRSQRIAEVKGGHLEDRVAVLEAILSEDRLT